MLQEPDTEDSVCKFKRVSSIQNKTLFKVSQMNVLTGSICPKTSPEALTCFKVPISLGAFTFTIHLYPQIQLAGTNVIFFNPVDEVHSVSHSVCKPAIIFRMIMATLQ